MADAGREETAPAYGRLEELQDLPQPELLALFDSLQLQIAFQPQTRTIDVEVALVADEPPDLRRLVRLRQRLCLRLKRTP